DVKALIKTAQKNGYPMRVLQAVEAVNESQKLMMFDKIRHYFNDDLAGKTVAFWGLSFKPETDDMREAPSLSMIDKLVESGCTVRVYDPAAMDECRRRVGEKVVYCKDMYEAVQGSDALFLLTEWRQFANPDWNKVRQGLSRAVVFDGRNLYRKEELVQLGFAYYGVGTL
ncbi:MAG: UDP-glucose 6-dehydrogenase, partial [Bacteroidales bacterium]|nr:UDP-glucose 6-dehydrogenase [Bacteroidales bacterium]